MMAWLRRTIAAIVLIGFSCVAFADPPPESGVVMREDVPYATFWFDFENETTTYFGVNLYEWCYSFDPAEFDVITIMEVLMHTDGEDRLRYKNHFTGDVQTSVWQGIVYPFDACTYIWESTGAPIASGWSRIKLNDNDVEPWLNYENRHNVNSFGFNANGVLYSVPDEEPMRFMMYVHAVWDGIDGEFFRSITKTKLK